MLDRARIEQTAKLLAKAASTDSEAEAVSLAEHCYRQLARIITEYDLERGESVFGPGHRERRLVADRRAPRVVSVTSPVRAAHGGAIYSELASLIRAGASNQKVDLTL